jgi:hypothetical protein
LQMIEVVINWAHDNSSITYNLLYNHTIVTIKLIRSFLTFDFTPKKGVHVENNNDKDFKPKTTSTSYL